MCHTRPVGWTYDKYRRNTNVATLFIGTHFSWLCLSVHRLGRVCPGPDGSQSKPSDMDSGKPEFMSGAPTPPSSRLRGFVHEALTHFRRARLIAWCLSRFFLGKCRSGPSILVTTGRVLAMALRRTHQNRPCAKLVWLVSWFR